MAPERRRQPTKLARFSFVDASNYHPIERNPLVTDNMDHVPCVHAPTTSSECACCKGTESSIAAYCVVSAAQGDGQSSVPAVAQRCAVPLGPSSKRLRGSFG